MSEPTQPPSSRSGTDEEWVKSVVAKALLEATANDERVPLAPTPANRPTAAWPEITPLDTAALRERAAAAATISPPPPSAPIPSAPTPSAPMPMAVEAPAVAVPADVAAPVTAPVAQPVEVPQEVLSAVEAEVAIPAADPVDALSRSALDTDYATSTNTAIPKFFGEPERAQEAAAPTTVGYDDVMVEADANTEGYRTSDLRTILEWLAVVASALVVALLIKTFVLQAFWIPSESMETTVNKGDRILVNKMSYRLHEVRRGDLVVFEKLEGTPGSTKDLIKRAIALPGETIEVRADGRIWIWGPGEGPDDALLLEEPYLDPQNTLLAAPSGSDPLTADIWNERCVNQPRTPGRCTLDGDSYFMLGDNRNRSSDSRFFGPVPDDNIVGRAFVRIWPLSEMSTL